MTAIDYTPGMGTTLRADPFMFYTLASSSFIESATPTYVENLCIVFHDDEPVQRWLREEWLGEETEHGARMTRLIQTTWPEFDWEAADREFQSRIPRNTTEHLQRSRALEALSRCVTETYTAMMYRCIASYGGDTALSSTLRGMSSDEVRHFGSFRQIYQRYDAVEHNGAWSKIRTLLGRTEKLRGGDLTDLFDILNHHWAGTPPFPIQSFAEFRETAKPIVLRHFPIEATQRMLFSPFQLHRRWERLARFLVMRFLVKRNLGGLPESDPDGAPS